MSARTMELRTPDEGGDRRDFLDWEGELRGEPNFGNGQFFWGRERGGAIRTFVRRPLGATSIFGMESPETGFAAVGPRPNLGILPYPE